MRVNMDHLGAVVGGSAIGGSITGQAIAWNKVHQQNKRSGDGFFTRMGRHYAGGIVGSVAGTAAGSALGAAGYLGYRALRK